MKLRYLSPEERPEHDLLMQEAGFDPEYGSPFVAHVIKDRVVKMLRDAEQAGHHWAGYILGDALANGAYEHWKNWNNADKKIRVFHNGSLVPARAMRGVRRRNDAGLIEHQQSFWPEMTWAEVQQQIDGAEQRIAAEEVTKSIGFKLLRLLIQAPDSTGPGDACKAIGEDFETYLGLTA